jgi:hypothetical protein
MQAIGNAVSGAMAGQLERQWVMLREALTMLDDGQYRGGEGYLAPARLLMHTIRTSHFYLADGPDGFDWERPFVPHSRGADVGDPASRDVQYERWSRALTAGDEADVADLPSREALLAYLEEVVAIGDAWLGEQDEAAWLGPTGFPWTGETRLAQMVYLLRHTQHHIGELNALLRTWDQPRVEWR